MPVLGERRALPVLGERERLASARGEGEPCQCWGRGRALPILRERARCWGRGRAVPVLGDRARLSSAGG